MCGVCGCAGPIAPDAARFVALDESAGLGVRAVHRHDHAASSVDDATRMVRLEQDILKKNDGLAASNRALLQRRGVLAINLMSSPGSGKTTLLERTIADSGLGARLLVIQGDQATDRDAERIRRAGARAVQINTGQGCHLDASMVARAMTELEPARGSLLAIENVGNLVCPALFDLGEAFRVTIISTTEGADKPLKYPHMFRSSDLVLINKLDLLEHVDFELDACIADIRRLNPKTEILCVSARRGDGLEKWFDWLRARLGSVEAMTRHEVLHET